jgi:hypothetical protein
MDAGRPVAMFLRAGFPATHRRSDASPAGDGVAAGQSAILAVQAQEDRIARRRDGTASRRVRQTGNEGLTEAGLKSSNGLIWLSESSRASLGTCSAESVSTSATLAGSSPIGSGRATEPPVPHPT